MRKRVLSLLLVLVLLAGLAVPAAAADETKAPVRTTTEAAESEGKGIRSLAFQNNLNKYDDNDIVRAIIMLDETPAVLCSLDEQEAAVADVQSQQANIQSAMDRQGVDYTLQYSFDTLLNGFSCDVAYGDLETIADLRGVDGVYIANSYEAPVITPGISTYMNTSNETTGVNDLQIGHYYGEGLVVAVLDTGLNTQHEAFQTNDTVKASGRLTAETLQSIEGLSNGKYLSAKVPFAYDYAGNGNNDPQDVTDSHGHGTHVSGIITGCVTDDDGEFTFSGVAPYAQLVSMKIFDSTPGAASGTTDDIYYKALEDCLKLDVDVINMSIGAQNGFTEDDSLTEVMNNIFQRLQTAGIVVCVSAGNEYSMAEYSNLGYLGTEYQDYGTVASPSTFTGNTSIASVENDILMANYLTIEGTNFQFSDSCEDGIHGWLQNFAGQNVDFVLVPDTTNANPLKNGVSIGLEEDFFDVDVYGKIAIVQRGTTNFSEKVVNAYNAGAIGCIVINNTSNVNEGMSIETFDIPAIMVVQELLPVLQCAIEKENATVFTATSRAAFRNPEAGLMSGYSNWGPSPMLTMDPVISSIGGDIYSTIIGSNDAYASMSGTSMSSPNFAGAMLLTLEHLKDCDKTLTKPALAEQALALLESTATTVKDLDGQLYSVRKQGSGLANPYHAVVAYSGSGYITNPIHEVGDSETGSFTFDITFTNSNQLSRDTYYKLRSALLCDQAGSTKYGDTINGLTSKTLEEGKDYTITYTVNGSQQKANILSVPAGESRTVRVSIQLTEAGKQYFDKNYPNGSYVEGFIFGDDVDFHKDSWQIIYHDSKDNRYIWSSADNAYARLTKGTQELAEDDNGQHILWTEADGELTAVVNDTLHATMLGYYGDWTDGPVLDYDDFGDYLEAEYFANTYVVDDDGHTYAYYGYSGFNFLDSYTVPNMAYTAIFDQKDEAQDLVYYLGANLFDYYLGTYETEYSSAHNAFTTNATDADVFYNNGLYLEPSLLRNCKSVTMTITGENSEVYQTETLDYLRKNYYGDNGWSTTYLGFSWTGKDAEGNYVPSGTKATVTISAVLPWENTVKTNLWSFPVEVDYTAPVVNSITYDKAASTVTVTATDESYLAMIELYDLNTQETVGTKYYAEEEGATVTAVFDVSDALTAGYLELGATAMDYATNGSAELTVPLYDKGTEAIITLVTPDGTTTQKVTTGDTFTFPTAKAHDGYRFCGWTKHAVQNDSTGETLGEVAQVGDTMTVTQSSTFYALYAKGTTISYDTTRFYIPSEFSTESSYDEEGNYLYDLSGTWAIAGHDCEYVEEMEDWYFSPQLVKTLSKDLSTTQPGVDYDATITEGDVYEFFSDEESIRFQLTLMEDDTYTICNLSTGEYLALDENHALITVSALTETAYWTISPEPNPNVLVINAEEENMLLVYNDIDGEFFVGDMTRDDWDDFGTALSYLYLLQLYRCIDEDFILDYYTTSISIDNTPSFPIYPVPGNPVKPSETAPFRDVSTSHKAYAAIKYLYEHGIMDGVGDNLFDPDATLTRAMVVTILYRLAGEPAAVTTGAFSDVPGDTWYTKAVEWAAANGIVNGMGDGTFLPNGSITREQLAAILQRYAASEKLSTTASTALSTSATVSDWAKDHVRWAAALDLLEGGTSVQATSPANRGEVAIAIYNFIMKLL